MRQENKEAGPRYQENWIHQKKRELIAANMRGDEVADQLVLQQVTERYGSKYARQWRLNVLEEHAWRRIEATASLGFED